MFKLYEHEFTYIWIIMKKDIKTMKKYSDLVVKLYD